MPAKNPQSRVPPSPKQPSPELVSQSTEMDSLKRQTLNALVGEQVLFALGKPPGLLMMQVRPLWGSRYRVNVFVGEDVARAKILHSYFVETDADGNVLSAVPRIEKRY